MTVKEIEYLLKAELGSHELDYLAETFVNKVLKVLLTSYCKILDEKRFKAPIDKQERHRS